ncbi:hypothetical protein FKM82_027924 [Ascaphus truei]
MAGGRILRLPHGGQRYSLSETGTGDLFCAQNGCWLSSKDHPKRFHTFHIRKRKFHVQDFSKACDSWIAVSGDLGWCRVEFLLYERVVGCYHR